jgi:hypothetical protein
MDSGNAHFGFATGPVPSPAVDLTSGWTACLRASFALGAEVGFFAERAGLGCFDFPAGMVITTSRSSAFLLALNYRHLTAPRNACLLKVWLESHR